MSYSFLDAYASVQTAESSVVVGSAQRQVVTIGSVLQAIPVISTNSSISGTIGASVIGLTPVAVTNIPSVSGQLGASVIGTVPVTQTGPWSASLVGTIPGSVVAFVSGLQGASISGTVDVGNFPGSVVSFQGTAPWVVQSIVGTYAEDAGHTSADKGIFTLGVRNDAVASFASANLDYTPQGVDSAGRAVTKPFAPEESRIEGYISLTSASITTMIVAAGAGLRNYITDVWVANTGASTTLVTFNDGAGSVLGFTIAPAGGGSNLVNLATPMRTGANATFDIKPATQTSTFYATAKGFKAP